jgi:hypothetical protein
MEPTTLPDGAVLTLTLTIPDEAKREEFLIGLSLLCEQYRVVAEVRKPQ